MWLMVLIILAFYFEIHTKFIELVGQLPNLANSLSYKFYVALTGTSSILSGYIHIINLGQLLNKVANICLDEKSKLATNIDNFGRISTNFHSTLQAKILNLGFILLCEYLYFRRNGYSFIEQMSLNHLSPWINPEDGPQNQLERPVRQSIVTKISWTL